MWVILPVKSLHNAKRRLAPVMDARERMLFSQLMLHDVLDALVRAASVQGITMISSDPLVAGIASEYSLDIMMAEADSGYSRDAMNGIRHLATTGVERIAIIPSDVPQLVPAELDVLNESAHNTIVMCPASVDGGTNALVFTPPLGIPLLYGHDSLNKHLQAAKSRDMDVNILHLPGLEHDIDRPEDLVWLRMQNSGAHAWSYIRDKMPVAC